MPYTDAGRVFSTVRRMKAEAEREAFHQAMCDDIARDQSLRGRGDGGVSGVSRYERSGRGLALAENIAE